jgi:hypothetical protein
MTVPFNTEFERLWHKNRKPSAEVGRGAELRFRKNN